MIYNRNRPVSYFKLWYRWSLVLGILVAALYGGFAVLFGTEFNVPSQFSLLDSSTYRHTWWDVLTPAIVLGNMFLWCSILDRRVSPSETPIVDFFLLVIGTLLATGGFIAVGLSGALAGLAIAYMLYLSFWTFILIVLVPFRKFHP